MLWCSIPCRETICATTPCKKNAVVVMMSMMMRIREQQHRCRIVVVVVFQYQNKSPGVYPSQTLKRGHIKKFASRSASRRSVSGRQKNTAKMSVCSTHIFGALSFSPMPPSSVSGGMRLRLPFRSRLIGT